MNAPMSKTVGYRLIVDNGEIETIQEFADYRTALAAFRSATNADPFTAVLKAFDAQGNDRRMCWYDQGEAA